MLHRLVHLFGWQRVYLDRAIIDGHEYLVLRCKDCQTMSILSHSVACGCV